MTPMDHGCPVNSCLWAASLPPTIQMTFPGGAVLVTAAPSPASGSLPVSKWMRRSRLVLAASSNRQTPDSTFLPPAVPGLRDRRLPNLLPGRVLLVEDNEVDVAMVRALLAETAG